MASRGWISVALLSMAAACSSSSSGDNVPTPDSGVQIPPPPPSDAPDGTDYLIISADSLAASAETFRAYRESMGHHVVVSTMTKIGASTVDAIHEHIRGAFAKRDPKKPFFVMILGDAPDGVPAGTFVDRDSNNVSTDNFYADMDKDDIPDLAVGRVAVHTDAEAAVVLDKIKAYESSYEVGAWNRRINLFASTSGFGDLVDPQIEEVTFKIVEEIPYAWDITLTYAKQTSPYVFVPERFSDKVYERMNDGALMMAYVGHGDTNAFATLEWSGKQFPILDTSKLSSIASVHRPPILTLIACLTGGFDKGESISEEILKGKSGPSAILSSTEISHPYANAIFIRELAQVLTKDARPTIGEIFVEGKRRMIQQDDALRKELENRVGALVDPDERVTLKQSHLYMYTLFGDPALRIAYPEGAATVTAPASAASGSEITIAGQVPGIASGKVKVTFERSRTMDSAALQPVPADGTPTRDAVIEANYTAENDRAVASADATLADHAFTTKVTLPAGLAPGSYYAKIYADDGTTDAIGSANVTVP